MKKLNITKEHFNKSRYFTKKYGKLEFVSESGKYFKTNKGKVLMFKESQPESPTSYDDEEWDDEGDEESNSKWVWKLYLTGKSGFGSDRYHENECLRESKKEFDNLDECVEDMFSDFFAECASDNNDSLYGPLWFSPDVEDGLKPGQISDKPYNTTKITYYPIEGAYDNYGIGKIVMEHDVADYTKWVWIVEKA